MYKVTNKLNQPVRYKDVVFKPNETKLLEEKPTSDKFHIEMNETVETPNKDSKGGKKK